MNEEPDWHQVNITFPRWDVAEHTAATHLAQHIDTTAGAWWFIRKNPCWRLRYQATDDGRTAIERHLDNLTISGQLTGWTRVIYEPEALAFGGPEGMAAAHCLFASDSRAILAYLRDQPDGRHRREISLMLCSIMMRAAYQDRFEQGDIWALVASYRQPLHVAIPNRPGLLGSVRRFLLVDAETQMHPDARLGHCADWAASYTTVGTELAALTAAGQLHRGLRAVLAHHVIFAWNRLGLPYATQSVLASTAKTVLLGPDPAEAEAG